MPATPWNACATAPPVSPEVATSTTSRWWRSRPNQAISRAINRAPKSLKASVGPWNNSSTEIPGATGTSGTGKSRASSHIRSSSGGGTAPPSTWPSTAEVIRGNDKARHPSHHEAGMGSSAAGT